MIEYVQGTVAHKTPTTVVIDVHGIGYEIFISVNTSTALEEGRDYKLLIHEVLREDTHDLYGFATEEERSLFRLLITVKGIGPSSARTMLSSYVPSDLARYIAEENGTALRTVKGVGARTAERIIVELKDKITEVLHPTAGAEIGGGTDTVPHTEQYEEAEKAFVALGYTPAQARAVVAKLVKQDPDMSVNDMVRMGLRML